MIWEEFKAFYNQHLCKTERELLCAILWCVKGAEEENVRLRNEIAELKDAIEQIATGGKLECKICGQFKPCICDK